MASASMTDAEHKADLSKKLTAFTVAQLVDYIEHTGQLVPEDRKTDKIFLKKLANELVLSGKYNISPFKLTTPAETSTPQQHEVAVKLFQEKTQNFDFEQYMRFTKSENERLENIRKFERNEAKAELKLAEKIRVDAEKIRVDEIKLAEKIRVDEMRLAEKIREDAEKIRVDEIKLAETIRH